MVQEWKWANEQHLEQPKHDWIILVSVYLGQRDNQNIFGVVVQTKDQQKFILLYSLCTAFYTLANETTMMIFVYFSKVWSAVFSSWQPDNQNSYKSFRWRLTTVNVEHVFDINWTTRQPWPIPSKVYHCLYILRTTRLPNLFSLKFWESWVFFLWTTRQPDSYNILKSLRWKMTAGTTY